MTTTKSNQGWPCNRAATTPALWSLGPHHMSQMSDMMSRDTCHDDRWTSRCTSSSQHEHLWCHGVDCIVLPVAWSNGSRHHLRELWCENAVSQPIQSACHPVCQRLLSVSQARIQLQDLRAAFFFGVAMASVSALAFTLTAAAKSILLGRSSVKSQGRQWSKRIIDNRHGCQQS